MPTTRDVTSARTVDRVSTFPYVQVLLPSGKTVRGEITGLQLEFPLVSFEVEGVRVKFEVSWETLLLCQENESAVRY